MQIARLTDRLKRIDAIEDRFVQFIELADDVTDVPPVLPVAVDDGPVQAG